MKKLIVILMLAGLMVGCKSEKNELFKEYKIPKTEFNKNVSQNILENEIPNRGLDSYSSSAHLVKLEKIGDYYRGEIKILGEITQVRLDEINKTRYNKVNNLVSYTCFFEYSEKTGSYMWTNNFPYKVD